MKVFTDIEQGSDAWKAIRKGKPTASRFSDIITAKTGELSKSAKEYIRELIGECFCPDWEPWQGNQFTDRGTELEPEARFQFAMQTGMDVKEVGFVLADDGLFGCSPDGLIMGADSYYVAGLEIKCPNPKTHIGYVLDGGLPDQYKQQVHGGMAVTGLNQWHFYSYFPGMKALHVVVERDEYTEKLSKALVAFGVEYRGAMEIAIEKLMIEKEGK
jgi:hypothetical protein